MNQADVETHIRNTLSAAVRPLIGADSSDPAEHAVRAALVMAREAESLVRRGEIPSAPEVFVLVSDDTPGHLRAATVDHIERLRAEGWRVVASTKPPHDRR